MTNHERTPHQVIVGITGNTFGAGDELARDILLSLEAHDYALVARELFDLAQQHDPGRFRD